MKLIRLLNKFRFRKSKKSDIGKASIETLVDMIEFDFDDKEICEDFSALGDLDNKKKPIIDSIKIKVNSWSTKIIAENKLDKFGCSNWDSQFKELIIDCAIYDTFTERFPKYKKSNDLTIIELSYAVHSEEEMTKLI